MTVSETNKILENSLENLRKKNYIKSFEFFVSSKNSENGDPIGLNSYFFYIELIPQLVNYDKKVKKYELVDERAIKKFFTVEMKKYGANPHHLGVFNISKNFIEGTFSIKFIVSNF